MQLISRCLAGPAVFAAALMVAFTILPRSAGAATVRYRTDAELATLAERIVHGRVLRQRTERPERPHGAIYTVTTLAVLEDLTGITGDTVEVWELGGPYGDEFMFVGGAVEYHVGSEVVVFLEPGRFGFRSLAMSLSKFDVRRVAGAADPLLSRNLRETVVVGGAVRQRSRTLSEMRQLVHDVRGTTPRRNEAADALEAETSVTQSFSLLGGGTRWVEADSGIPITWYKNSAAPVPLYSGNGVGEIQTALSAWTTPSSASLILQYGGESYQSDADGPWSGVVSPSGLISFEDPFNEISGSTLAIGGGFTATGGGTVNGTTFARFTRGYVIFQNAADLPSSFRESLNFARVLEHEIGHGVGLGHTPTDGSVVNPQTNIMYASCCTTSTPVPPALGADDLAALNFIYPQAQVCTYSLDPTSVSVSALGGNGSTNLATQSGCAWTAVSDSSFITVRSATSGTGPATVSFTVAANTSTASRSGTITIGGRALSVTQAGAQPCTYTISPGSVAIGNTQYSGAINVATQAQCAWTASSNDAFITLPYATSGSGSGLVVFVVQTNFTTSARTGTIAIAGQTFTVSQAALDATRLARERSRADFTGDGNNDFVWQESTRGYLALWALAGGHTSRTPLNFDLIVDDPDWLIVGTGDFNGDGKPDIVWHHRRRGSLYLWYMDGARRIGHTAFSLDGIADVGWRVAGIGDFNGDRKPDIVWQHDRVGWLAVWLLNGATLIGGVDMDPIQVDVQWKIAAVSDLDGDGDADLVWRNEQNGQLGAWMMNGTTRQRYVSLSPFIVDDMDWQIVSSADVNGDSVPDLVWRHRQYGWIVVWYMNGVERIAYGQFPWAVETTWRIAGPK